MENKYNKVKKGNFVYSKKITKDQHSLLKNNKWIKKELNKLVEDFLKIYEI